MVTDLQTKVEKYERPRSWARFETDEPWHGLCRHNLAGNLRAQPRKYRRRRAIIFRSGGVVLNAKDRRNPRRGHDGLGPCRAGSAKPLKDGIGYARSGPADQSSSDACAMAENDRFRG